MEVKAKLNNLRISPRKVRLVANLIKGMPVAQARVQLNFLLKKSALPMVKLLNSAAANAKHNFKIEDEKNLYVKEITVNAGQTLFRIMPRAMGRAAYINKRTSRILLVLAEKNVPKKKDKVKVKKETAKKEEKPKTVKKKVVKSKKEEK